MIDYALLEYCIREELNENAPRRIAVLDPVKVIVDNYPEDKTEILYSSESPRKARNGEPSGGVHTGDLH